MSEAAATFKAFSAPGLTGPAVHDYLGTAVGSLKEPAQVSGENSAGFSFGHRRSAIGDRRENPMS
jgi:hypothetical protein